MPYSGGISPLMPAGASVDSASVTLNVTNPSTQTYQVYDLKRPWVESAATWQLYASGSPWEVAVGQGLARQGGAGGQLVVLNDRQADLQPLYHRGAEVARRPGEPPRDRHRERVQHGWYRLLLARGRRREPAAELERELHHDATANGNV